MGRKNIKCKKYKKSKFNIRKEFLKTKIYCTECKNEILYYCKYDCEVCLFCNVWLGKQCGDPDCTFCANRPNTPIEALEIEQFSVHFTKEEISRNYKTYKKLYDPAREKSLDKVKNFLKFPDKNEFRARRILEQLKNK